MTEPGRTPSPDSLTDRELIDAFRDSVTALQAAKVSLEVAEFGHSLLRDELDRRIAARTAALTTPARTPSGKENPDA